MIFNEECDFHLPYSPMLLGSHTCVCMYKWWMKNQNFTQKMHKRLRKKETSQIEHPFSTCTVWSIFNFLCSSNSYLATTYTYICSLHAYGIDVNFAYIFVTAHWSLLPTFLLLSFPLWHVFIWFWLWLRGLRNRRLCLFISLTSPSVLRIFWPNSIFLRNYIVHGWNLRITTCMYVEYLYKPNKS
jgi:hypothetical protein